MMTTLSGNSHTCQWAIGRRGRTRFVVLSRLPHYAPPTLGTSAVTGCCPGWVRAQHADRYATSAGRGRKRRTAAIAAIVVATGAAAAAGTLLRTNREPAAVESPGPAAVETAAAGPSLFDGLRGPGFVSTSSDETGSALVTIRAGKVTSVAASI